MPLQTAQGYQLQPDILGSIELGQKQSYNQRQRVLGEQLQQDQLGQKAEMKSLREKALGLSGEMDSIVNSPSVADEGQLLNKMGLDSPEKKGELKSFADKVESASDEDLPSLVNQRVGEIVTRGGDPSETIALLKMPADKVREGVSSISTIVDRDAIRQMYAIDPKAAREFLTSLRGKQGETSNRTPAQKNLDTYQGLSGDDKSAFGRAAGFEAKTLTLDEKIKLNKIKESNKTDEEKQREIDKLTTQTKLAPNLEKQKLLAKDAGKLSTTMFQQMSGVEKNIANLEEGIRLIDEGAAVGPVDKWFPSFKAASVEMENLKNRLGIDVIGQVTFGALSAGELQLALDTAIPPNLGPEELKAWFQDRIEPQRKLLAALEDASIFLAEDGATIPKLMAKRRQQKSAPKQGGVINVDANGNRAIVYPDGTFKEL